MASCMFMSSDLRCHLTLNTYLGPLVAHSIEVLRERPKYETVGLDRDIVAAEKCDVALVMLIEETVSGQYYLWPLILLIPTVPLWIT